MTTEFEKLAEELEVLAKAKGDEPTTEDKVAASAEDAGVDVAKYDEDVKQQDTSAPTKDDDQDADLGDDDGGDEDDVLGKSFAVQTADGEQVRAYDATELLKSFAVRIGELEAAQTDESARREHLGKSLELISDMLKAQDEQIAELRKSIEAIGDRGVGRKSIVTVTEKPDAAGLIKSAQEGLSRAEFLAKAEAACRAGKISGQDIVLAEAYLNRGQPVPEGIVSRVMGNQ